MNLGRYMKAIAPALIGVMTPIEDWGLTGHLDWPHERFALVMLAVATIVYLLPNVPVPVPTIELSSLAEPVKYATGGFVESALKAHPQMANDLPAVPPADGEAVRADVGHGVAP